MSSFNNIKSTGDSIRNKNGNCSLRLVEDMNAFNIIHISQYQSVSVSISHMVVTLCEVYGFCIRKAMLEIK